MWGIIPAAGAGSRIQPLAFSKELLPVGSRLDGGVERPRAVSEYLIERMLAAGASKICIIISPGKSDILHYYGGEIGKADISYVVQSRPAGLCDALFRTLPLIQPNEQVLIGLPDTIWFPQDALCFLPDNILSFLLFPVKKPELFDTVITDTNDRVIEIQVKCKNPKSEWIWGAIKLTGRVLHHLHALWCDRGKKDEFVGTLINAYLEEGNSAWASKRGEAYVDVGTLHGYREAIRLLSSRSTTETMTAPMPLKPSSIEIHELEIISESSK